MMLNTLPWVPKLMGVSTQLTRNCGAVRFASKKTSGGARWQGNKRRPKYKGVKFDEGSVVSAGSVIVKQNRLNCFPGLNVGLGRNGNLFAMVSGKVMASCEKTNSNWDHTWIQTEMAGQFPAIPFYKTYYHVIPEPQHSRFKLVETV